MECDYSPRQSLQIAWDYGFDYLSMVQVSLLEKGTLILTDLTRWFSICTWWRHGVNFRDTGPDVKGQWRGPLIFLCTPEQTVKQTVYLPVIQAYISFSSHGTYRDMLLLSWNIEKTTYLVSKDHHNDGGYYLNEKDKA